MGPSSLRADASSALSLAALRRVASSLVSLAALLAACSTAAAVDFGAVDLLLVPLGGSTYDVIPRVALHVGTTPPAPVPLEYQLQVGGAVVASHTEPVNVATLCQGPGCSGSCRVSCGEQINDGSCLFFLGQCDCIVSVAPLPALHAVVIPPGSTCKLVLDPQGLVAESDETNNSVTVTVQGVPALGATGMLLVALGLILAAGLAWRRATARVE